MKKVYFMAKRPKYAVNSVKNYKLTEEDVRAIKQLPDWNENIPIPETITISGLDPIIEIPKNLWGSLPTHMQNIEKITHKVDSDQFLEYAEVTFRVASNKFSSGVKSIHAYFSISPVFRRKIIEQWVKDRPI